jgi:hypothetical protein
MMKAAVEVARADVGYPHPNGEASLRIADQTRRVLKEALRWQRERNWRPDDNDLREMGLEYGHYQYAREWINKWMKILYRVPEHEANVMQETPMVFTLPGAGRYSIGVDYGNSEEACFASVLRLGEDGNPDEQVASLRRDKTTGEWIQEFPTQPKDDEFMECDSCRKKPGSPTLCYGCLHNRTLINSLRVKKEIETSPSTLLHRAFHRAWTAKVGTEGYNKEEWNQLDGLLNRCLYPSK